jgi:hypothetical protein
VNALFWADARPDPKPVWAWYEVQRELIADEKTRVQAVLRGALQASPLTPPLNTRYLGRPGEELDEFFGEQRRRLDMIVMFELLATTEGVLRIDFQERVDRREKDPVSRRFRELAKKHPDKIQFEEHILETWKEIDPRTKNAVGSFKGVLGIRHWLAHGRHWKLKLGRPYGPNDIFDIATELLNAVGAAR